MAAGHCRRRAGRLCGAAVPPRHRPRAVAVAGNGGGKHRRHQGQADPPAHRLLRPGHRRAAGGAAACLACAAPPRLRRCRCHRGGAPAPRGDSLARRAGQRHHHHHLARLRRLRRARGAGGAHRRLHRQRAVPPLPAAHRRIPPHAHRRRRRGGGGRLLQRSRRRRGLCPRGHPRPLRHLRLHPHGAGRRHRHHHHPRARGRLSRLQPAAPGDEQLPGNAGLPAAGAAGRAGGRALPAHGGNAGRARPRHLHAAVAAPRGRRRHHRADGRVHPADPGRGLRGHLARPARQVCAGLPRAVACRQAAGHGHHPRLALRRRRVLALAVPRRHDRRHLRPAGPPRRPRAGLAGGHLRAGRHRRGGWRGARRAALHRPHRVRDDAGLQDHHRPAAGHLGGGGGDAGAGRPQLLPLATATARLRHRRRPAPPHHADHDRGRLHDRTRKGNAAQAGTTL